MLDRLKAFFEKSGNAAPETEKPSFSEKQVAAAALLIEAAVLDGDFDNDERQAIHAIAVRNFALSEEEADQLIKVAQDQQQGSTHLLRFTRIIKDNFSENERIELIEMLWEVAYADGVLHDYESNLLRRIGGLIYVSDRARGEARLRVVERLGIKA
jgi:uncharacterized tellurite resistance protein B-like protein